MGSSLPQIPCPMGAVTPRPLRHTLLSLRSRLLSPSNYIEDPDLADYDDDDMDLALTDGPCDMNGDQHGSHFHDAKL